MWPVMWPILLHLTNQSYYSLYYTFLWQIHRNVTLLTLVKSISPNQPWLNLTAVRNPCFRKRRDYVTWRTPRPYTSTWRNGRKFLIRKLLKTAIRLTRMICLWTRRTIGAMRWECRKCSLARYVAAEKKIRGNITFCEVLCYFVDRYADF